jgi:uncharacterized LabA/DUF88 family protein
LAGVASYEKGVDIMLTTDMLTHSFKNNYDVVIRVSEYGDYTGALQAVKDNGKNVEVALFGQGADVCSATGSGHRIVSIDGRFMRGCWK